MGVASRSLSEVMFSRRRRTLECFEKMARVDVGDILVGMILEEFLTGLRTAQAAQHAELAVMDIGDSGAGVSTL